MVRNDTILSDNGTNFRAADTEMKRLLETFQNQKFQEKCIQKNITRQFSPPGGPHQGGGYDAIIKAANPTLKD